MLDVAKAVGVSEATISRYESGNIKNMRRDRIEKYAKILKVSPVAIIGIDDPSVFEETEEVLNAPLDVAEALDYDAERIYEFMQAVDADREEESAKEALSRLYGLDFLEFDNLVVSYTLLSAEEKKVVNTLLQAIKPAPHPYQTEDDVVIARLIKGIVGLSTDNKTMLLNMAILMFGEERFKLP